MDADSFAFRKIQDLDAQLLYHSRDFMAKGEWQRMDARSSGAIMSIGMADPRGFDTDQNVGRPDLRNRDVPEFERESWFD